jgi:hypothetical protein
MLKCLESAPLALVDLGDVEELNTPEDGRLNRSSLTVDANVEVAAPPAEIGVGR